MLSRRHEAEQFKKSIKASFAKFLNEFKSRDGKRVYFEKARQMINANTFTLLVSMKDLNIYDLEFASGIISEYNRLQPFLNDAVTSFVSEIERTEQMQDQKTDISRSDKYYVAFQGMHPYDLRKFNCSMLGNLSCLRATVTKTTEVRPQLVVGVFKCKKCNMNSHRVVQQYKYTEPKKCKTDKCDSSEWEINLEMSEFADYQRVRVQEDPMEIPPGSMPRSLEVILRNECVEKAQPGDICHFTGNLTVQPDIVSMLKPGQRTQMTNQNTESRGNVGVMEGITGLKETGVRDLNYKLVFVANWAKKENDIFNTQEDLNEPEQQEGPYSDAEEFKRISQILPDKHVHEISEMSKNPHIFDSLAESLFPSIYGNLEVKKAILLQILSGVHKTTETKLSIRGDLNILIVGDPSTAKSQFLKAVHQFLPRCIYTSGKTTSAAGLTATVTRDENGEVGIEAGALMLADSGVCCIDEFDKMDIKDQVAIHEAMEQQTISIAKAGISATLNSRTSILAAANPIFGRYDKTKTLKNNIDLSAPIMSRFDLFFVLCDESNELRDRHIGDFILNMHMRKEQAVEVIYSTEKLQNYIKLAKKINPRITHEAAELLRKFFLELRKKDKITRNTSYMTTVRQLESLIRLSEAIARLNLNFQVKADYVRQAYDLLSKSILEVEKQAIELELAEFEEEMKNLSVRDDKADGRNLVQQELQNRQKEKREVIKMTHEIYSRIQNNILNFLKQKELESQKPGGMVDDNGFGLRQKDIVAYLQSENLDNLNSEQELKRYEKICNAAIRRLVDNDRVLQVSEDNAVVGDRVLCIHPNFIE